MQARGWLIWMNITAKCGSEHTLTTSEDMQLGAGVCRSQNDRTDTGSDFSTRSDLVIVDPKLWDSLSFGREPPGKDLVGEGGNP